jgi:ethanolamine ammonia-lyase large subunit
MMTEEQFQNALRGIQTAMLITSQAGAKAAWEACQIAMQRLDEHRQEVRDRQRLKGTTPVSP